MDQSATRIAIAGAAGRMGRSLVALSPTRPDLSLVAALEDPESPHIGADPGLLAGSEALGFEIGDSLQSIIDGVDVLIDFTVPEATLANTAVCRAAGKRMVIGTTGLGPAVQQLREASADIALVFAPNMSVGVNLCFRLVELAAQALGDDYDVEIIEAHHRHKIDAPSGTAVRMGEIIADALGRDLKSCAVYGREGRTGARDPKTIGFDTIRAGEIVGEHTVLFAGPGERVEITHRAADRATFSTGAFRAAAWISERDKGMFDMLDVLGLRG